jgi:hypothetical protein
MDITRRGFIGNTVGGVLLAALPRRGTAVAALDDRLRVGLLGIDRVGLESVVQMLGRTDVVVTALQSADGGALRAAAELCTRAMGGRRPVVSVRVADILGCPEVDAVLVNGSVDQRAIVVQRACAARKDVLCYAPLIMADSRIDGFLAAVVKSERVVHIISPGHGVAASASERANSGALGDILGARIVVSVAYSAKATSPARGAPRRLIKPCVDAYRDAQLSAALVSAFEGSCIVLGAICLMRVCAISVPSVNDGPGGGRTLVSYQLRTHDGREKGIELHARAVVLDDGWDRTTRQVVGLTVVGTRGTAREDQSIDCAGDRPLGSGGALHAGYSRFFQACTARDRDLADQRRSLQRDVLVGDLVRRCQVALRSSKWRANDDIGGHADA